MKAWEEVKWQVSTYSSSVFQCVLILLLVLLLLSPLLCCCQGLQVIGANYGETRCPYHVRWMSEASERAKKGIDEKQVFHLSVLR